MSRQVDNNSRLLSWFNDLRVDQREESCIGLIQENSIGSSVQDCLSYILKPNSLYLLWLKT